MHLIDYVLYFIILQILCIHFYLRNQWVRDECIKFTNQVYKYQLQLLDTKSELYKELSHDDMLNCLESYYKILFSRFWCWDITKFVTNKDLYNKIINITI